MDKSLHDILEGYGWEDMGIQKNKIMISFKKEESNYRINFYFTSGTLTIQSLHTKIKVFRDITTPEQLEDILVNL